MPKDTCPAHGDYREGCDACKADHAALMDVLAAQAGEAAAITARMTKVGVEVPQGVLVSARVEALVEALLVTRKARLAYEWAAGEKTLDQLRDGDEALKEATKIKIVNPHEQGIVVPGSFGGGRR